MMGDKHDEWLQWLASGERGMSSEALFSRLTGIAMKRPRFDHPWDVYDFGRCVMMLDACPSLAPHVADAADLSRTWAALISEWDGLVSMYRMDDSWEGPANMRIRAIVRGEP